MTITFIFIDRAVEFVEPLNDWICVGFKVEIRTIYLKILLGRLIGALDKLVEIGGVERLPVVQGETK